MYLCFLIFPIWANRRARRRFSRLLQATRGTPSRSLDLFSMYMVFYLFVLVTFTIYWVCILIDVGDCWRDPECGAGYFREEAGVVEFWYSVLVQIYALLVLVVLEVHSHWVPVPYSGNSTVGMKTTVYNGQTSTVYSNGTTTIMSKGVPATVYLATTEISTVYQPTIEISTEVSTVFLPITKTVLNTISATPEGWYLRIIERYVTETPHISTIHLQQLQGSWLWVLGAELLSISSQPKFCRS